MNAGTIAKVCSGSHRIAQQWSRYFYETYEDIDGIIYPNGHNNDTAIALYREGHRCSGNAKSRQTPEWHINQEQPHFLCSSGDYGYRYVLYLSGLD